MKNPTIVNKVWPQWQIKREVRRDDRGILYEAEKVDIGIERSLIRVLSVPENETALRLLRHQLVLDEKSLAERLHQKLSDVMNDIRRVGRQESIVTIYDMESERQDSGTGWHLLLRMEPVRSLSELVGKDPFQLSDVVKLGRDISNALESLESAGVVHGRVSPDSIYLAENGKYKLGDIGFSHLKELEKPADDASDYEAPEVLNYRTVSREGDIYSLGLVLYQLLNDRRLPFASQAELNRYDRERLQSRRMTGEPAPPLTKVDEELNRLIQQAIHPDPTQRLSASAFKNQLKDYEQRLRHEEATMVVLPGDRGSFASTTYQDVHTEEKHVYEHQMSKEPVYETPAARKPVLEPPSKKALPLVMLLLGLIVVGVVVMAAITFGGLFKGLSNKIPEISMEQYAEVKKGQDYVLAYPDGYSYQGLYVGDMKNDKPEGQGPLQIRILKIPGPMLGSGKMGCLLERVK